MRSTSGPPTWPVRCELLHERPDAILVAGSTDWGVEVNIRGRRAPYVVGIDRVPELRELHGRPTTRIVLGAALTLTELERRLGGRVPLLGELFPQFASRLIRNGATMGGNLGTGSPIGDCPPALLALERRAGAGARRGRADGRRWPTTSPATGRRSADRTS